MDDLHILDDEIMEKITGGLAVIINSASGKDMPIPAVIKAPGLFVAIATENTPL